MTTAQDSNQLEPSILVIFGITGDLAKRKVLPALYHLYKDGLLHDETYLVGTSRRPVTTSDIMEHIASAITEAEGSVDQAILNQIEQRFTMLQVDPTDSADYDALRDQLQAIEDNAGICLHRLFYLSIPPQVYGGIVQRLGEHGLNKGCSHGTTKSRLLVEKPFGYDLASAEELIAKTAQHFNEDQIFRIDHYLAKETAQNILTFRKHNPLFSQIWNSQHITGISITAAEEIGIEGRANFYDQVGALRDLIQSHLIQLLTLTLMEVPEEINSTSVHAAKQAVLDALIPMPANHVGSRAIRGQYKSYRDEVENQDSNTETYASLVLFSEDERWGGIPLRLTTGKALKLKRTSVTVDFGESGLNRLQFRIQPNEGIRLTLQVKKPGYATDIEATSMDFSYQTAFNGSQNPDAYERVLVEAIRGDRMLFATDNEVLAAWRILQPVINEWGKSGTDLVIYDNGSDGPDVTTLYAA